MRNINPPIRNCSLSIFKVLWLLIFLLGFYGVKADDLAQAPAYSQLVIIVGNLSTGLLDKTTIGFNPNSTDTFNPQYDAYKLAGLPNRQTLYTLNNGNWMSINVLPDEATVDTVDMGMDPGVDGSFSMSFTGLSSFDTTTYIYLEDKKLDTWYDIRKGNYNFTSLTTDDWNRFVLHFTPPVIITATDTNCSATSTINIEQPGMAYWNYTLADSSNTIVNSGILNENQPVSLQAAPGTYNLTLTDTNGYIAAKTIQISGIQTIAAQNFFVSDSDVQVLQAITLNDSAAISDSANTGVVSYQWNFGNGTTGTGIDTTVSYTQPGTYKLGLTVTNQWGCSATQIQKITVTSNQATNITETHVSSDLNIWSHDNKVYVDFTGLQNVDATITIYNILGQEVSNERCTNSVIYQKEMDKIPVSYLLVKADNNHETMVKKVFISNK